MGDPSIFERMYDQEINFSVSCFFDAGFDIKIQVKLGDV